MIFLLAISIGFNVACGGAVVSLWRARQRTYRYAVERADFTAEGRAYSDMATVIVLDGNVSSTRGLVNSEDWP